MMIELSREITSWWGWEEEERGGEGVLIQGNTSPYHIPSVTDIDRKRTFPDKDIRTNV